MSGTIPLSLTQQLDEFGQPLSGGFLYIIAAGTVADPQNAYKDLGLQNPWPNPILLDAAGRIPQFFLADGFVKVRLQDKNGIVKFVADNLLVIGPSSSGGGPSGPSVDPDSVMKTGDIKVRYDNAQISGFVRCNGGTIGNSGTSATELPDASANQLFHFLWNTDGNLPVLPSRGSTSDGDWLAGKVITLPDFRGCVIGGRDGMGNTPIGRLTNNFFGPNADMLGALGGNEGHILTLPEIAAHQHPAYVFLSDPGHFHTVPGALATLPLGTAPSGVWTSGSTQTSPQQTGITAYVGSAAGLTDNRTASAGGSLGHNTCQPTRLVTIYMRL
jgi:microcystin-dependent protein